jgi:RND superfamily putative drug exporter
LGFLDAQHADIDEGRAELESETEQLERGDALAGMAADIRSVSEDGDVALVRVIFTEPMEQIEQDTRDGVIAAFEDDPVPATTVDFGDDIAFSMPHLFGPAEAIGLMVAAAVLVIMLRTLVGAGLPIVTALVGVGVATLTAMSLSGVLDMVSVTPILGLMLGLAVGIDYSLFIVNRHRRQLKQGIEVQESIGLANGTSGNAVVFAGATVFVALLGLNLTGVGFLGLMGSVAALAVTVAVLVGLEAGLFPAAAARKSLARFSWPSSSRPRATAERRRIRSSELLADDRSIPVLPSLPCGLDKCTVPCHNTVEIS